MNNKRFSISIVVLLLAALACNLGSAIAPEPPTATALPTLISTNESFQPTVSPPALSPTLAVPNAPLSAIGPWLIFSTSDGLWAINSDGSGLTQMTEAAPTIKSSAVAPGGGHLAFITSTDFTGLHDLKLNLITLPQGDVQTLTLLRSAAAESGPEPSPGDPAFEAVRAIVDLPGMAWSPDGRKLAFIGAQDGPSADLYVYSLDDGSIARLTDGPSQAYDPSWSPDGKNIVQLGADQFGTGAGYSMAGVWAARADGSAVVSLYKPNSGDEVILGWTAPDTFAVYSFDVNCSYRNFRLFNIETRTETVLWKNYFTSAALDPASGRAMISVDDFVASCNQDSRIGMFLISAGSEPKRVSDEASFLIAWSKEADLFFAPLEKTMLIVTPSGDVTQPPAPMETIPAVAPDGKSWAWPGPQAQDLFASISNAPPLLVYSGFVPTQSWSPDGKTLIFVGDGMMYAAYSPEFNYAPITNIFDLENGGVLAWVRP